MFLIRFVLMEKRQALNCWIFKSFRLQPNNNRPFFKRGDFVYEIKRLRRLEGVPFMIERGYVPINVLPGLNRTIVSGSVYEYIEKTKHRTVTKSFMTIMAEPSNDEDQELLELTANEPVGIMEGIFFMDDGTPLEFSTMRLHYKYLRYNAFVSLDSE